MKQAIKDVGKKLGLMKKNKDGSVSEPQQLSVWGQIVIAVVVAAVLLVIYLMV